MKKEGGIVIFLIAVLILGIGSSFRPSSKGSYEPINEFTGPEENRAQKIQEQTQKQAKDFRVFVEDSLKTIIKKRPVDEKRLQENFLKARLLYKKVEWAAEYFISPLAQRINGPPDIEVENADLGDPAMAYGINPSGLQVIEELLFPYNKEQKKLAEEVALLVKNAGYLEAYFKDEALADWRILDAVKQEVFRIITMGITGFDNPLTLNSMEESAASLNALRKILTLYGAEKERDKLISTIDRAVTYLNENNDFDIFDRAVFITEYANAISRGIAHLEKELPGKKIRYNRLLNQDAETLFDAAAFNVNAFTPGGEYHLTDAKVALGEKLFYDKNLSGNATRSCATCHQPALGFADGMTKNKSIHQGNSELPRNTPTLLNTALQSNYFYDMRVLTIEDQTLDVIQNTEEMDGDLEEINRYLGQDVSYQKLFEEAFPSAKSKAVQSFQVANALASYVRSLTRLDSRFDKFMRGRKAALTQEEVDGFNLFMGKAKCATCHFVPLFNGTTPPKYMQSEAEVIGVPLSKTDSIIDPDKGWYDVVGVDAYKHAFKTPTIRNISKTGPYMHNGIYKNLDEVMEFYNNAGAVGLGIELENMTLPEDSLQLSDNEIDRIIAFMESLNDEIDF